MSGAPVTNDLGMITVTVSGPGGVIAYEVELVRRALEAGGLVVIVKDDFPLKDIPNDARWRYTGTANEQFERMRSDRIAEQSVGESRVIRLVADHLPWGG